MFQKEFTNTLNQLARRGMSEPVLYREKRSNRSRKLVSDESGAAATKNTAIQLKLFDS